MDKGRQQKTQFDQSSNLSSWRSCSGFPLVASPCWHLVQATLESWRRAGRCASTFYKNASCKQESPAEMQESNHSKSECPWSLGTTLCVHAHCVYLSLCPESGAARSSKHMFQCHGHPLQGVPHLLCPWVPCEPRPSPSLALCFPALWQRLQQSQPAESTKAQAS